MDSMHDDHVIMQDGRVMVMRGGDTRPLDEEMTLPDGTKIMVDGTMMMSDGTTRMMEEGERMLLEGEPAGAEDMTDRQFKESMEDEELRDEIP